MLSYHWLLHVKHLFLQSLRSKESRRCGQILILLDWLVQDEFLFQYFMESLADIISRKEDRYVSLGWCTLVRGLLECESAINQYLLDGKGATCPFMLRQSTCACQIIFDILVLFVCVCLIFFHPSKCIIVIRIALLFHFV